MVDANSGFITMVGCSSALRCFGDDDFETFESEVRRLFGVIVDVAVSLLFVPITKSPSDSRAFRFVVVVVDDDGSARRMIFFFLSSPSSLRVSSSSAIILTTVLRFCCCCFTYCVIEAGRVRVELIFFCFE